MTDQLQTIEINGVKFEIDARTATLRKIDTVKIGARVKVLTENYNGDYAVHHGTVVGFEPFADNPVIIIAYVQTSYSSAADIKFLYYSAKSKEKIVISDENDKEALEYDNVINSLDNAIEKKRAEMRDLEDRKNYFKRNFKAYWGELALEAEKTA